MKGSVRKKSNAIPYIKWHEMEEVDMPFDIWLEYLDAACFWTKLVVADLKEFNQETEAMLASS